MSNRIVVPVDGSEHSLRALDLAVDIARQRGCGLRLVHVIPSGTAPVELQQWAQVEHLHEAPQWLYEEGLAENVLGIAQDRIARVGDLDVDRLVERGDAARRIIALSEDADVEMVVMGSRGLSDFVGLVVGSVAHKVAHSAHCPVVTVSAGAAP